MFSVEAFLAAARHSNTLNARFKRGSRKAGLGLRRCKEHPLLCVVGWWTHCALNPAETEALFPMAQVRSHTCSLRVRWLLLAERGRVPLQEIWRVFKALHSEDAEQCEWYAAQLAARGLHVIPGTGSCFSSGAACVLGGSGTHATTRRLQPYVHRRWPSSKAC